MYLCIKCVCVCVGKATRLCEAVDQWATPNVINCIPEEYAMLLETVSYYNIVDN